MREVDLARLNRLEVLEAFPFAGKSYAARAIWVHEGDGPGVTPVIDDPICEIRMIKLLCWVPHPVQLLRLVPLTIIICLGAVWSIATGAMFVD